MPPGGHVPRAAALLDRLSCCDLCPRRCLADRTQGPAGVCATGARARVSAAFPHFGEERVLVGRGGSGTVFLAGCNLGCTFCQNAEISHGSGGTEVDGEGLASLMLGLQAAGCGNVNLVTPSHVAAQILDARDRAAARGLRVPVVWNSSAYDLVDTLRALEGAVDIYLPDLKTLSPVDARAWADAPDYPDVARAAIAEMHRQVGDLVLGPGGAAVRGVIVRHLVMPGRTADAADVFRFVAGLSPGMALSLMDQYRPFGGARTLPGLDRRPTRTELDAARGAALDAGLRRML